LLDAVDPLQPSWARRVPYRPCPSVFVTHPGAASPSSSGLTFDVARRRRAGVSRAIPDEGDACAGAILDVEHRTGMRPSSRERRGNDPVAALSQQPWPADSLQLIGGGLPR
jgi:hypothetical protein